VTASIPPERLAALETAVAEITVAIDRMLNGMGKGRAPSPRLQAALDEARRLIPSIPPQLAPRDDEE